MDRNAEADAFADRLVDVLNGGAIALLISLGHRTGLFDSMAGQAPATPAAIAAVAGLQERYVREWLNGMTVSGIIAHDADGGLYSLPAMHAGFLTRDAAPDNLAAFAQYIPLLGTVEDQIVDCFKAGGGVPYAAYTRFHEVMAEDSGQTVLPALIDHILPLVPGLTEKLNDGIDVLDVGCGSGRALNLMARHFPASRFQGFDLSEEATGYATAEARAQGSDNVRFDARDVTRLESGEQYDLICAFDAIHDQADPAAVLAGIQRTLKPGGTFLMQDISASSHVQNNMDHPIAPLLYTMSCMHCMTVSLAQDGAGLGAMWGRELALKMLAEAGFGDVKVEHLDHDFQNAYYVAAKG